ncbi:hypothetical protein ACP4OV_014557 [Aristida adscensionis]
MKRRHIPPVLFLLALSLLSFSSSRRRLLLLPHTPSGPASDLVLRRLAAADVGGEQLVAEAAELLANATVSSSPSLGNHHRLLCLRVPRSHPAAASAPGAPPPPPAWPRTVTSLRVPASGVPSDGALLAAFRASLRAFLLARRQQHRDVAGVMRDLAAGDLLPILGGGRRGRRPTCAVVGNSGVLLGSRRGPPIDAHDAVIRLNNARVAGFAADVGARTSLSFATSNVLHRCAARSALSAAGCGCHPYGPAVPMAVYLSQPAHLLDALVCNATAASPLPFLVTDARLDALCARIAKYYSLRRFTAATGEPPGGWARRRDERFFHYSSGLEAVVVALAACEEVSLFGFGKAAGARHHYHGEQERELDLHDYEAEYDFYRDLRARPAAVPFIGDAPGFRLPPVKLHW